MMEWIFQSISLSDSDTVSKSIISSSKSMWKIDSGQYYIKSIVCSLEMVKLLSFLFEITVIVDVQMSSLVDLLC